MKKTVLYVLWGVLFAVCAGLGFIPEPEGALKWLCTGLSVAFFVPPMLLARSGDRNTVALVRLLALMALILASVLLVLNILSSSFSEMTGIILHYVLIVAASPLICSRFWALTLFLWAYLMLYCGKKLKQK